MRYLLFLICWSLPAVVSAQNFVVRADKTNVVYIGMDNPITVVAGSCSCDALSVSVDKGSIEKIAGCKYRYIPKEQGSAYLTISEKKGAKSMVIGQNVFRVKLPPDPKVTLGGKTSGSYPLNLFKAQVGLTVQMEHFTYDKPYYKVTQFTFTVVYLGGKIISIPVTGNAFDSACKEVIAGLKAGDRILIENISVACPDCVTSRFATLLFTLK